MGTRRDFMAWLSALSLAGLARPLGADDAAEEQAAAAAREWLSLVDGGACSRSWETAAPIFRMALTPEQWYEALRSVRMPLGRCLSRVLRSRKSVEAFPGAPRGPYVVLKFEADFERGAHAVETVTPVRGPDGRWRIASYFVNDSLSSSELLTKARKRLSGDHEGTFIVPCPP